MVTVSNEDNEDDTSEELVAIDEDELQSDDAQEPVLPAHVVGPENVPAIEVVVPENLPVIEVAPDNETQNKPAHNTVLEDEPAADTMPQNDCR